MKTFLRQITLAELTALCVKKRWVLDTRKHDVEGSDWVAFRWKFKGRVRDVIYSPWNGHFIVAMGRRKYITERSPGGAAPWLDDLLNVLFTNEPREKEAAPVPRSSQGSEAA